MTTDPRAIALRAIADATDLTRRARAMATLMDIHGDDAMIDATIAAQSAHSIAASMAYIAMHAATLPMDSPVRTAWHAIIACHRAAEDADTLTAIEDAAQAAMLMSRHV